MNLLRLGHTSALLLGSVFLSGGCSGGTGGDGSGGGGGGDDGDGGACTDGPLECEETVSPIDLDEMTELGFSAADVLEKVGGDHEDELVWRHSQLYCSHARAGSTAALTLSFEDEAAVARYVDSQGGGCPCWGDGPCIICEPWIEIDLPLSITTADGALDETVPLTLVAETMDLIGFSSSIDISSVGGAYFDSITPDSEFDPAGIHVMGQFGAAFSGSVDSVPSVWNGFAAAILKRKDQPESDGVFQAHGYFPPETAGDSP